MRTILVVDDDLHILELVRLHLVAWRYKVLTASSGEAALRLADHSVDLAIVDVMMPGVDGFQLTARLKEEWDMPVLMLTAKGELEDKREGFMSGVDDYVVKPFEPEELLFRVQAILRRYDKPTESKIEVGDLEIDRQTLQVVKGKQKLMLPLKEFELLAILASRPGQVFERRYLMEQVWGLDYENDDTLNTHMKRIRERLSALQASVHIHTARGVGYWLEEEK
ncbi:response regulator transcription factor [Bacillus thermotolerans]|uniref:response regulator transcription factor n=1 Tax=Bacillus thermotolerans TaxID=1221996 RepID=UPI00057EE593|nr:response regulator transcription factor [Bacillus thermotolerans]KKB33924.1 Two-component response regulator colocalized with HrtAB transporter [Bacillus thermotolerans]